MDRERAEEVRMSVNKFAAAVQEYSRAAEQLAQSQSGLEHIARALYALSFPVLGEGLDPRRPLLFNYLGVGGMKEEEAATLAWDVVHSSRVPGQMADRMNTWPTPSPEEVRKKREARRHRES